MLTPDNYLGQINALFDGARKSVYLQFSYITDNNAAADGDFQASVFRVQSSVHNKGIIVDDERVLISSTNWSGDGVLRNRDAGLIIHDAEIAGYYRAIFLDDWDNRARAALGDDPPVMVAAEGASAPAGIVRMSWRDYFG